MTKQFPSTRKSSILAIDMMISVLVVGALFLLPCASHAMMDEEVCLLNVDGSHMVLYWAEEPPYEVKVQTSSDGGASWTDTVKIVTVPPGYRLIDFDGIYRVGTDGRLIASFAVDKTLGQAASMLVVMISEDYGQTWNSPKVVLYVPGASNLGNPANETEYNDYSGAINILTTLNVSGTGYIYFVSSDDGGTTWNPPHRLGEIPTE